MKYSEAMSRSRRCTGKYDHYSKMYDIVLESLPSAPTVLEIGIANGGSLQTWRTLLGPDARIIGVDLNRHAKKMEEEGFEVLILDAGLIESWEELQRRFFRTIDLLVDDGGHTNRQQILALTQGTSLIKDNGWLVLEDLHASFMKEFGNPSPGSTARFLNRLSSDLHRLHPRSEARPRNGTLASSIDYMLLATSWAGLRIHHDMAAAVELKAGEDASLMDYDHRWDSSSTGIVARVLSQRAARLMSSRPARRVVALCDWRRFFWLN